MGSQFSGRAPPIVRGAHLIVICEVLREIGVPVESELRRTGLPGLIEELPNEYVTLPLALDWVKRSSRDIDLSELGYRAALKSNLQTFAEPLQQSVLDAPSGYARILAFQRHAWQENCSLIVEPRRLGDNLRIICDTDYTRQHPALLTSEWLQLQAIISVVRSVAGPGWAPEEMTFISRGSVPDIAFADLPNTRFLFGQRHTSVLLPAALASQPAPANEIAADARPVKAPAEKDPGYVRRLRRIVRPYLAQGNPGVDQLAEVVGTSRRSLQRRLSQHGTTWSGVLTSARYELACELLADHSYKVIDVALATGYEHAQHFARAFRQVAGVSPRTYRSKLRRRPAA